MIEIHYDFNDGREVSYGEGKFLGDDFKTCCLDFFTTKRNVTVYRADGSYINTLDLLKNDGSYTSKEIRTAHNIRKMLVAGSFAWKENKNLILADWLEIKMLDVIESGPEGTGWAMNKLINALRETDPWEQINLNDDANVMSIYQLSDWVRTLMPRVNKIKSDMDLTLIYEENEDDKEYLSMVSLLLDKFGNRIRSSQYFINQKRTRLPSAI